jgi:hypothetical protein
MNTQLGKDMGEKQSSLERSLSNMQQSLTSLSGFIEDFKWKLKEVEKLATEWGAKIEELGREVKGLKDARTKQAEAIQELRVQCKEGQVSHVSLLARLVACEVDTTERISLALPPPPPPAVSSVWCKRVEKLEVAEAAQDRPNQERVLLDLRITGPLFDIEMVPEAELQAQVTESLGKAIGIEGNELGITGVRLHRVRTTRGARASTGTAAPFCTPPQIIVTSMSLAAKKKNLQNKGKSERRVRIASELTPWQVGRRAACGSASRPKGGGEDCKFLGASTICAGWWRVLCKEGDLCIG